MLPAAAIEPTSPAVTAVLLASKFLMDAGLVLTLGLLATAIALPNDAGALRTAARSLLRTSRATAAVTATATLIFTFATTADVMGVGLADVARSLSFFESLLAQTSLGHSLLWQLALLLGYGLLCQFAARATGALLLLPVLLGVVVARASTGHSGNSGWHMAAIEAWAVHIGALCVWMGVVAVVAWRGHSAGDDLAGQTLQRLSGLLRTCMLLVLLSGAVGALVRLTRPMDLLTSRYG
ncbi:MAG: hypothetical protein KGP01_07180, partial [Actinomycetales bacterium]|nr:hypothetical protein [Actinomycetales bacterium]